MSTKSGQVHRLVVRVVELAPNFWLFLACGAVVCGVCSLALNNRPTLWRDAVALLFLVGLLGMWGANAPDHATGEALSVGAGLGYFAALFMSIYRHAASKPAARP